MSRKNEIKKLRAEKARYCERGRPREAAECCGQIADLLNKQLNYAEEAEERIEEARFSFEARDAKGQCIALREAVNASLLAEDYSQAVELSMRLLEASKDKSVDEGERQAALHTRARAYWNRARSDPERKQSDLDKENLVTQTYQQIEARKFVKLATDACSRDSSIPHRELIDKKIRAIQLLSLIESTAGSTEAAVREAERARDLVREHSVNGVKTETKCLIFDCLTEAYYDAGQYELALLSTKDSEKVAQTKTARIDVYLNRIRCQLQLGDFRAAKKTAILLRKLRFHDHPDNELVDRIISAGISVPRLRHYEKVLTDPALEGDAVRRMNVLEKAADLLASQSIYFRALDYYERQLAVAKDLSIVDPPALAVILISCGETADDAGDCTKALDYLQQALALNATGVKQTMKAKRNLANYAEKAKCEPAVVAGFYQEAARYAELHHLRGALAGIYSDWYFTCKVNPAFGGDLGTAQVKQKMEAFAKYSNEDVPSESERSQEATVSDDEDFTSGSDTEEEAEEDPSAEELAAVRGTRSSHVNERNATYVVHCNEKGESKLHRAAIKGDLAGVKEFIEEGHPINCLDNDGWTPLHEASNWGHIAVVQALLSTGRCELNARNNSGLTSLMDACANGHLEIGRLLLAKGAKAGLVDKEGMDALDHLRERVAKDEAVEELDPQTLGDVEHFEAELSLQMKREGYSKARKSRKAKSNDSGYSGSSPNKSSKARVRSGRQLTTTGFHQRRTFANLANDQTDRSSTSGATKDYQAAMMSVAGPRQAARQADADVLYGEPPKKSAPALIPEGQLVDGNDWMVQDMPRIPRQRKRRSSTEEIAAEFVGGAGHRNAGADTSRAKRRSSIEEGQRKKRRSDRPTVTTENSRNSASDPVTDLDSDDEFLRNLDLGRVSPDSSQSSFRAESPVIAVPAKSSTFREATPKRRGWRTDTRIHVVFEDNTRVSVVCPDGSKPVRWLCEAAKSTYTQKRQRAPRANFVLESNGYTLNSDDMVQLAVDPGCELQATYVESIDETYVRECTASGVTCYANWKSNLSRISTSGKFELRDRNGSLKAVELIPLFTALRNAGGDLRSLVLEGTELDHRAALELARGLNVFSSLQSLDCLSVGFDDDTLSSLACNITVPGLPLSSLTLSSANCSSGGITAISEIIRKCHCLATLNLSAVGSDICSDRSWNDLSTAIAGLANLESLAVCSSRAPVSFLGGIPWSRLTKLSLASLNIQTETLVEYMNRLQVASRSIQELDLRGDRGNPKELRLFAIDVRPRFPALKSIEFSIAIPVSDPASAAHFIKACHRLNSEGVVIKLHP